jgi:hypothetical protein
MATAQTDSYLALLLEPTLVQLKLSTERAAVLKSFSNWSAEISDFITTTMDVE